MVFLTESIKCKFSDVSERDMDLLFLEEFSCSQDFADIFLSKIGMTGAKVIEIEQSKVDVEFGESDMTVIVDCVGRRHAILIEDKIDAIAMPNQSGRYSERGKKGIENGDYISFDVFIIAPKKYLEQNEEAKKYPNSVTYEECLDYFSSLKEKRATFKIQQIKQAICKQKTGGYTVIENKRVTDSWEKYIAMKDAEYPYLWLATSGGPKGAKASWPRFNTVIKGLYMYHKTEFGFIDMNFSGCAEKVTELRTALDSMLGDLTNQRLSVHVTGKSAVLRMRVPVIDFKKPFEEQHSIARECFEAIAIMTSLAEKLDKAVISEFIR